MRSIPRRPYSLAHLVVVIAGMANMLSACADPPHPNQAAEPGQVIAASNLAADAKIAAERGMPIVVVVTRHDCPYCVLIKRKILRPMLMSGDYEDRVTIRELMIDPDYALTDFAGETVSASELAARHDAIFTPTVLLLDASGNEIAKRLVGINTTELYGYYLDEAINTARARLQATNAP